jgi:hypothetical protein
MTAKHAKCPKSEEPIGNSHYEGDEEDQGRPGVPGRREREVGARRGPDYPDGGPGFPGLAERWGVGGPSRP